jgi:hypothetical protein
VLGKPVADLLWETSSNSSLRLSPAFELHFITGRRLDTSTV